MREIFLNGVIFQAIENLRVLFGSRIDKSPSIDGIFKFCERKFYELEATAEETDIRLFALALYCDKVYNRNFFESVTFLRFADALDFFHFQSTARRLLKENDPAMVVFWVVFRLSFINSIPRSSYLPLEEEMRCKSLSLLY
jgi:hypothetical protein